MVNQNVRELLRKIQDTEIHSQNVEADDLQKLIKSQNKLLNIIHLNIRSIQKNFNELILFLESYNI